MLDTIGLKQKINNILNTKAFVVIMGILIYLKTFFFYSNTIAIHNEVGFTTYGGKLAFVAVIVCFLCLLPNRTRIVVSIIVNLFLSILLLSNELYYSYSMNYLSVTQFSNIQYSEEIRKALPSLINANQILYFVDFFILAALFIFRIFTLKKIKFERIKKNILSNISIVAIALIIFYSVCVTYIERGLLRPWNKDFQVREATIFGYHIADIISAINIYRNVKYHSYEDMMVSYNELRQIYDERFNETLFPGLAGISANQNMIILHLESLQQMVINQEIDGQEITPNLNKFLNENIMFSNMNVQSYATTADAEFSLMTSVFPLENGVVFSRFYRNDYDNIFKMYNNAGFHTSYMHGNWPYFWNRGNVLGRMPIDELVLRGEFPDHSETINGDLSDEIVFRQAVQKLSTYQQPFFSKILSASSHNPFLLRGLEDRSKVTLDVGRFRDTHFGNYLEAINYLDFAFGVFLDELRAAGLYEDTTIFIVGDHAGVGMYEEGMMEFMRYINPDIHDIDFRMNFKNVVAGIRIPNSGLHGVVIDKPVSKVDIKPTLAYLSDLDPGFSLGTSMFLNKNFIILNNERIVADRFYFDEVWFDIETGEPLDMNSLDEATREELSEMKRIMKKIIDISVSVNVHNLLDPENRQK